MVVPISWDWGKHPYSAAELASVRGKATSELSPRVPASRQALSIEASRVSLHQPGGLCHSTLLLLQRKQPWAAFCWCQQMSMATFQPYLHMGKFKFHNFHVFNKIDFHAQPFKDSLPMGNGLPTVEEKGGFRLKQGYTDLIYLSPDFFSCASFTWKA